MSDYERASDVAMASCDNELLEEYARGRSGAAAGAVEAHVATCVVCREELSELSRERALFAAVAAPPDADLPSFAKVYAATQAARATVRARHARRAAGVASLGGVAVAAVALLVVGRGSFYGPAGGGHAPSEARLITAASDGNGALFEEDNEDVLGATCGGYAHRVCTLELPAESDDRISKYENAISVTRETFTSIRRNVCE